MPEQVHVDADGQVVYRQRYWALFSERMDFQRFPFDRQTLGIRVIAAGYTPEEVRLAESDPALRIRSAIAADALPPEWRLRGFEVEAGPVVLVPGGLGTPAVEVRIEAVRRWEHFVLKLILPLCLIVVMSWVVFWIDPMELETNSAVAVTSVLTIIAYRFSVSESLSRVPYATRLDAFVGVATIMVFLTVIQVVYATALAKASSKAAALRVDRLCRVAFPVAFVLLAFWALTLA
ncbi:MAG: hypothetical protein GX591_18065 [Planctomycetes bacterium]|nr:hypothetical protein [Planctomycetota bacterium]